MRRVQCIAEEGNGLKMPIRILHQHEVNPLRVVREQLVSVQIAREYLLQKPTCFLVSHCVETRMLPRLGITFDEEGAGGWAELIRMRSEDTSVAFAKSQRQAVEQLTRAVPNVLVGPDT